MSHFNVVSGLSREPRYDFFIYANGYREAAVILTDDFLSKSSFNDSNGYPIFFLFRHSLELFLKGIIYNGAKLASYQNLERIDEVLNNTKNNNIHDLVKLEEKASKLLKGLFPDDSEIEKICIDLFTVCKKISVLDPNSYSYRYPIDTKGDYSTRKNQTVDIKSYSLEINRILIQLDIIDFGISIRTDDLVRLIDDIINE